MQRFYGFDLGDAESAVALLESGERELYHRICVSCRRVRHHRVNGLLPAGREGEEAAV